MRKLAIGFVLALVAGVQSVAPAGPSLGGMSSDNVEWLSHVPFDAGTATGARLVDDYLYVTSWRNFSIYDVSDPLAPALQSTVPFGYEFENEDVATNGKIMLFSESSPFNVLHVWDVEDKTNPVKISDLAGAGDHTMSCVLGCKWAYGSNGSVVDLRDPAEPENVANWLELIDLREGAHDVEEFKRGFVVVSTYSTPLSILDVRDPKHPKVVGQGEHPAPQSWIFHSARWPNSGRDRFLLMEGEGSAAPVLTYDAHNWRKRHSVSLVDSYSVEGSNASSHWFQEHPDFHNGGLVAAGWYEEGTRFLEVSGKGKIKEVGWYVPHLVPNTWAAYWLTDEIAYSIDLVRGIDILRFTPT